MLPLEQVSIVEARTLKSGEFALLHALGKPLLVGTLADHQAVVILDQSEEWAICDISELPGFATRIDGWRFEVDFASVQQLDHAGERILGLAQAGKSLGIVGLPPTKHGWSVVRLNDEDPVYPTFIFNRWRIVTGSSDRPVELFAKA